MKIQVLPLLRCRSLVLFLEARQKPGRIPSGLWLPLRKVFFTGLLCCSPPGLVRVCAPGANWQTWQSTPDGTRHQCLSSWNVFLVTCGCATQSCCSHPRDFQHRKKFCPSASCSPVCFSRMLKRAMNTPGYLRPGPAGWTSALWNWVPRHGYRCLSPEPSPSHAFPEGRMGVLPRHCLPASCTSSRSKRLCLGHSSGHSHSGLLIGTAGNRQVFRCRSVLRGIIFCIIFFDK